MHALSRPFHLLLILFVVHGQSFQPAQNPLMVLAGSAFEASSFGPKPARTRPAGLPTYTSADGTNIVGPDFVGWIGTQVKAGKDSVALAAGSYHVSQPTKTYPGHINLTNFANLTIWMDGVNLTMTNPTQSAFNINSCSNLTMYGPTVHWDVPGFSQATITNVAQNPKDWKAFTVRFQMDAGYDSSHFWNSDKNAWPQFKSQYTNPATGLLQPGGYSVIQGNPKAVGDNIYEVYITDTTYTPQVGYKLLARGSWLFCNQISSSNDTRVFDYTLLNCGGFGFFTAANRRTLFDSLSIKPADFPPPGGTALPARSSSADGVHSADDYEGPTWDSCYFAALDDDAMAVHGSYQSITSVNGNTVTTSSNIGAAVGAVLRFYQTPSYTPLGSATVTAKSTTSPWPITVDSLPSGVAVGSVFVNTARVGSGFRATNNFVNGLRGRGIIAKGSNGFIDNNHFDGVSYAAINLGPDKTEADFVHNITVLNNLLTNNNYLQQAEAVIFLHSADTSTINGHSDIQILNNVIVNTDSTQMVIASASNVRLENNQILGAFSGSYTVPGQFSNSVLVAKSVNFAPSSGHNCVVGGLPPGKNAKMTDDLGNVFAPPNGLDGLISVCM